MTIRTNAAGELQILHPETGAYVPATTLLQVENGLLAALVPEQVALLADIRNGSAYLRTIESALIDVRTELFSVTTKLTDSNNLLTTLDQINAIIATVRDAIDSLESLTQNTNTLLSAVQSDIGQLSGKIPSSLGAKIRDASLSVALATDSTIFASLTNILSALTNGGTNSAVNLLAALSTKIPLTLGAKIRDESMSVALATDSTIFASLTNILNALSGGGSNNVYNSLVALSAKIPASLGAKVRDASLSVALATDSTIFASLTNILNALSDGGSNSALTYLSTVATAQHWRTPTKLNAASPIFNAATGATSSGVYALSAQSEAIVLQNYFSVAGISAQFSIDLRLTTGATGLGDRTFYCRGDVSPPFAVSTAAFPGESPIVIPTYGHAQVAVHLISVTGAGNVTTYLKELK